MDHERGAGPHVRRHRRDRHERAERADQPRVAGGRVEGGDGRLATARLPGVGSFRERCAAARVSGYEELAEIDINDPALQSKIGSFGVVNCTGIFYHLPSPVAAFENLRQVVDEYLVVNTVTVPETIENASGTLAFRGSVALFLPGVDERERAILREHYQAKFEWAFDDVAPRLGDRARTT